MRGNPVPYVSQAPDDPRREFDGGLAFRLQLLDPAGALSAEVLEKVLREDFPFYVGEEGRRRERKPSEVRLDRKVRVEAAEAKAPLEAYDVWWKSRTSDGQTVERDPRDLRRNLATFLASATRRTAALQSAGAPAEGAAQVALSEPFPSLDVVGSSVAERLKNDALIALFLSLVGIIVYVAIRFKSRAMGISAVLCLFHDVAFTLGIVAVANALGLVDAKINLVLVAAFLTLVGFSTNDTVVIFDRIRENRGKKATITSGMIDDSINQTLIRSIKTNFTVFLVCLALFALNIGQRNVLEGFAFVLLVGTVIGSYSTIAIASPLLLFLPWFWERVKAYRPRGALVSRCVGNPFLIALTPFAAALYAAWWVAFGLVAMAVGTVLFPVWAVTVPATEAVVA
jgi:preprotein translocase SecF subunit